MKLMAATKKMVVPAVLAVMFPSSGYAANTGWRASHACNITSPDRGDAPRISLTGSRRGEIGGEVTDAARLRLFNIPTLSNEEKAVFSDTVAAIPGFANWSGIKASGRREDSGYALYIPLPSLAEVIGPMESGHILRITVQAKDAAQTFEIDLTGSVKAMASFRACAT